MTDFDQILKGLIQRTEEGKLKWSRTVRYDRFVASVDTITLEIVEVQNFGEPTHYRLDLLNEYEEVADSFGFEESSEAQDRELERLFRLARRSANNVEATLEKLAKALDL